MPANTSLVSQNQSTIANQVCEPTPNHHTVYSMGMDIHALLAAAKVHAWDRLPWAAHARWRIRVDPLLRCGFAAATTNTNTAPTMDPDMYTQWVLRALRPRQALHTFMLFHWDWEARASLTTLAAFMTKWGVPVSDVRPVLCSLQAVQVQRALRQRCTRTPPSSLEDQIIRVADARALQNLMQAWGVRVLTDEDDRGRVLAACDHFLQQRRRRCLDPEVGRGWFADLEQAIQDNGLHGVSDAPLGPASSG